MSYAEISHATHLDAFIKNIASNNHQGSVETLFELGHQQFQQIWDTAQSVRRDHPEIDPEILKTRIMLCYLCRAILDHDDYLRRYLLATWAKLIEPESADVWGGLLLAHTKLAYLEIFRQYEHSLLEKSVAKEEDGLELEISEEEIEPHTNVLAFQLIELTAHNLVYHTEKSLTDVLLEFRELMANPDNPFYLPQDMLFDINSETEETFEVAEILLLVTVLRNFGPTEFDTDETLQVERRVDPQDNDVYDLHILRVSSNPQVQTAATLNAWRKVAFKKLDPRVRRFRGLSHIVTDSLSKRITRLLKTQFGYTDADFKIKTNISYQQVIELEPLTDILEYFSPWEILSVMYASLTFSPTYTENFLKNGELPLVGLITFPSDKIFAKSSYNTKTSNGE